MEKYDDIIRSCREHDIVEVARWLDLPLKRRGTQLMTHCLWHTPDTHPSMQVGGRHNVCHCYSCGETHGVIDLVMQAKNYSFKEAVETLSGYSRKPPQPPRSASLLDASLEGQKKGGDKHGGEPMGADPNGSGGTVAYFNPAFLDGLASFPNRKEAPLLGRGGDEALDSLSKCLLQWFDREVVERVARMYRLGVWCSRRDCNSTVFPLIDRMGRIHDLKVQHYDTNPNSPRFAHSDSGTYWLGTVLQREGKFHKEATFDHEVLFGEHLVNRWGLTPTIQSREIVGLVESPKNAVVAACAWPDITWVATGNKGMLKRSMLEPLRGRDVLVYADEDAVEEWGEKLRGMQDIANFVMGELPKGDGKSDIADHVIARINNLL